MYVINNAEKFNASSANTILKFLEEPKPNILGFLITNNIENVIPTVRSRCEYIKCYYDEEELKLDDNYVNIVKDYLTSIFKKDNDIVFNKTNMVNTYTERSDYEKIFNTMLFFLKEYYEGNIEFKLYDGVKKNNVSRMMILIENILKYIKSNVNIDLVLDKFVIEMRNYYE
jgi:DNA polymerase III delta prime subunit